MGNGALNVNGFTNTVTVNNHITVRGSDWYWAACALMVVSTGAFIGLSFTKPRSARLFHHITATITLIAAIAYFSMASNLGWTGIQVEFQRGSPKVSGNIRQIFYVRHIDWFLTTPLLLLDLLLTAGLPWPTICITILIDEVMVVTGLVGALVHSSYKWGFFVFGVVAFFIVACTVVFDGRSYATALGADVNKFYTMCAIWIIGLWCIYPIAWGVSEGGNVIAPDSEAIFYGVLDVLTKPVFGAFFLWGHRNLDITRFGLHIYEPGASGTSGTLRSEKAAGDGATNGTNTTDTAPTTTV
jgi:bacteriorhodopsin